MVILVITEKLKPFEKSIYHEDDSVRLHNHRCKCRCKCSGRRPYVLSLVFLLHKNPSGTLHWPVHATIPHTRSAALRGVTARLHTAHALVTGVATSSDLLCQCMFLSSTLLTHHATTQVQRSYDMHHEVISHGSAEPPLIAALQETWRYSYPLHTKNTVPAWVVPTLSTCGPASVFVVWYLICRPSRWEMHNLLLGLMASVFACALITNMIKITVHPFSFSSCIRCCCASV